LRILIKRIPSSEMHFSKKKRRVEKRTS